MKSTTVQIAQMTLKNGVAVERAQDAGYRSRAVAVGDLSVRPVTEHWTLDVRFRGTRAWDEGKVALEQFVAASNQRMALRGFATSFMTCLIYC